MINIHRILQDVPTWRNRFHQKDLPLWWHIRLYSEAEHYFEPFLQSNVLTPGEVKKGQKLVLSKPFFSF